MQYEQLTGAQLKLLRFRYRAAIAGYCMFYSCSNMIQRNVVLNTISGWLVEDKQKFIRQGLTYYFENEGHLKIVVGHGHKGT